MRAKRGRGVRRRRAACSGISSDAKAGRLRGKEGRLMRYLCVIVALLGVSVTFGRAVAQGEALRSSECPIKTPVENAVIARAWHDEVINRRNPAILQDILASDVVHHAAGDYPK